MKVTVTLIPSNHPEYLTEIKSSSSSEIIYQFQTRFAAYRDFAALCDKISPQLMAAVPFPPTHTASAYGFKLSDTQLMERKNLLEQWLNHFVNKFNELDQQIILSFYSLATNSTNEPTRDELGRFCLTLSNAKVPHLPASAAKPPKHKKQGSYEWTTVTPAKKGQKRQPTNILTVRVSRSSMSNGHQQYETIITYDKGARPFRMEKVFKFYRKLALELDEHGVNVGAIGGDETETTLGATGATEKPAVRRRSGVKTSTGEIVEISLPPFPESFIVSSFGIKLTDSQLQQRCQKLHDWMRDLLCAFHLLPLDCQALISNFLMLDEDETVDNIILYSLRNGWILNSHGEIAYVAHTDEGSSLAPSDSIPSTPPPPPPSKEIAARINNIVNLVHSKFTGNREETPKLKALTIDALKQQEEQRKQNEMIIVRTIRGDEIHGHPSYETTLSTSVSVLVKVVKYFKDYRQLAFNLSNQGVNVGTIEESQSVLSGVTDSFTSVSGKRNSLPSKMPSFSEGDLPPFPRTYKRSSLGLKLPERDLQERCNGLDRWVKAVCQMYVQFSSDSQAAINEFFGFDETNESHQLAMRSLSSGFVCYSAELPVTQSSAATATSPSGGALSQISEEISRTEPEPTATAPSVNSSGTNEPETSGDPTAAATPKKSKGIADFVSAKMIGHKLKESLGLKHTATEDPQTPSSESPAATSPAEAVKRDEEQLTLERERKEREEKANCQLTVVVTRGELLNSHPSYELTISCVKENTCYSLSYYFKDYRALALQLSKEGVNVGTIGDEENDSPTAAVSASANGNSNSNDKAPVGSGYRTNPSADSTDGSLHLPLPPFPRTYARSTFGIKLGETELQERAEGLDRWLRALLQRYQLYSAVVQAAINQFLKLDDTRAAHLLILNSLSVGWVAINPKDALAAVGNQAPRRRQSALGKLFPALTSRDDINEEEAVTGTGTAAGDVVTTVASDDEDWIDIRTESHDKKTMVAPVASAPSTAVPVAVAGGSLGEGAGTLKGTTGKSEQSVGKPRETPSAPAGREGEQTGEEEEEEEIIHITPQMKKTVGCAPKGIFCVIS